MSRCRDDTYRSEDGNGFFAEPHRVEDVVMENRLEQVVFIIGFERRLSGHHLIHQHPQGPPVHRGSVLQLLQDLISTTRRGSTWRRVTTTSTRLKTLQHRSTGAKDSIRKLKRRLSLTTMFVHVNQTFTDSFKGQIKHNLQN